MKNPFEYIKTIQDQWAWQSMCKTEWVKIDGLWILKWNLSTGGLSDHERIIGHMDKLFWNACWVQSRRGGHYIFEIHPYQFGFLLVNNYARKKEISRQYIYHNPEKFEWAHVSDKIKFIKPILIQTNKVCMETYHAQFTPSPSAGIKTAEEILADAHNILPEYLNVHCGRITTERNLQAIHAYHNQFSNDKDAQLKSAYKLIKELDAKLVDKEVELQAHNQFNNGDKADKNKLAIAKDLAAQKHGYDDWYQIDCLEEESFVKDEIRCMLLDDVAVFYHNQFAGDGFQSRVLDWLLKCFGAEIAKDVLERNDRFIEESLELVQALGYNADRAHALVDYVFSRPKGEAFQEVGGVMVTLAALCSATGLNMAMDGELEYARISKPEIIEKIRKKQAAKPTGSALPIALPQNQIVNK